MQEDESLYNAIIVSLVIGIIIVIITLVVARPAPERFSELYFENHKELPKYVNDGSYDFNFSIVNHEGGPKDYNYTITKEYYNFDYGCLATNEYFREQNSSLYDMFLKDKQDIATRISDSKDPSLLLHENSYKASFDYEIYSGSQIVLKFKDPDGMEKYSLVLGDKAYLLEFKDGKIYIRKKSIKPQRINHIDLSVKEGKILVSMNQQQLFDASIKDYTDGFLSFETTRTYADIRNFQVEKDNKKNDVRIAFDDIKYQNIPFTERLVEGIDYYTYYKTFLTGNTLTQNTRLHYYEAEGLDFDTYSMEFNFNILKGDTVSLGIKDGFEFIYNEKNNDLILSWQAIEGLKASRIILDKSAINNHQLKVVVDGNDASIYFDQKKLRDIKGITKTTGELIVKSYNSDVNIRQLLVRHTLQPKILRYTIREETGPMTTVAEMSDLALLQLIDNRIYNNTELEDKEVLASLFDKMKSNWTKYRVQAAYVDPERNNTVLLTYNDMDSPLYSLKIDDSQNSVEVQYRKDGKDKVLKKEGFLTDTLYHQVAIDVSNNTVSMKLDDSELFRDTVDKSSDGVLLLDYPENTQFIKLQMETDTEVKVLKMDDSFTCKPIMLDMEVTPGDLTLSDEEKQTLSASTIFNKDFDIAKVSIGFGDQEIHFWVSKI